MHLSLPRFLAQIVVAHHTVKIERPGGARIDLNRSYFRHFANRLGNAVRDVGSHWQRCPFGHVQYYGKFRFVV